MNTTPPNPEQEQPQVREWRLDPARSTAEFRVKHFWGLITVTGHFDRFDGVYAVSANGGRIELTIDADSLDTGNPRRDRHLRSSEFFDAEEHPQTRFRSTSVVDAGKGRLHVDGTLEAAGKSVPLSLDATVRELDGALEIEATTTVDHRLFDMTWSPLGTLRSPATLHVRARLT